MVYHRCQPSTIPHILQVLPCYGHKFNPLHVYYSWYFTSCHDHLFNMIQSISHDIWNSHFKNWIDSVARLCNGLIWIPNTQKIFIIFQLLQYHGMTNPLHVEPYLIFTPHQFFHVFQIYTSWHVAISRQTRKQILDVISVINLWYGRNWISNA